MSFKKRLMDKKMLKDSAIVYIYIYISKVGECSQG